MRPVAYVVTIWPESVSCMDSALWCVSVCDESYGNWSVRRGRVAGDRPPSGSASPALGRDGKWHYGNQPSERTREEIEQHRFTLEEALELARDMAPRVELNGIIATVAVARHEARRLGLKGGCPGCAGPYVA